MKTFIITSALLLSYFALTAKPAQRDTGYKQAPSLKKFDGTWEYSDDSVTFKIVLKARKDYFKEQGIYMDVVEGYHLLIRNKKVIQNSIAKNPTIILGNYFYDFYKKAVSENVIRFYFTDLQRDLREEGKVELLPGNKLKWTVRNHEGIGYVRKGQKAPDREIHVPNNIILKKVM